MEDIETKKTEAEKNNELKIDMAKFYTHNVVSSVITIQALLNYKADFTTLSDSINDLIDDVSDGKSRKIENSLVVQAKTLQIIFNRMTEKATSSDTMDQFKAYMDVALRAQNQARKTILALQTIQHPPQLTQITQQNVALNQQVNNGISPELIEKKSTNELLEVKNGQRLDASTKRKAIEVNPQMAPLGVGGSKNT